MSINYHACIYMQVVAPFCCLFSTSCRPFIDGLHLFEGLDEVRLDKLKNDTRLLQDAGRLVKLSYGGEEWGNSGIWTTTGVSLEKFSSMGTNGRQRSR